MTTTEHPWRRATTPCEDRMSDIDLSDEIHRLSKFAACLSAAIKGAEAFENKTEHEGILWLASDIASDIAALAEAFDKERKLRQDERAHT